MKAIINRLRVLERSRAADTSAEGPSPADILRERFCRRKAEETGRPYEELLREDEAESEAFWKTYDGDHSISSILRHRFKVREDRNATQRTVGNGLPQL